MEASNISLGNQLKHSTWIKLLKLYGSICTYLKDFHNLNLSSEDCIFDEKSMKLYLKKEVWGFIYKFFLFFVLLYFLFFIPNAGVFGRTIFTFLFLYVLCKIIWFVPMSSLQSLQLWGITEGFCFSLCLVLMNSHNIMDIVVFHCIMGNSILYLSESLKVNISVALYSSLIVGFASYLMKDAISGLLSGAFMWTIFHFTQNLKLINDLNCNDFIAKANAARHHAEQAIQSKNMYYSSVTHDLKNPLNSILGTIDYLKSSQILQNAEKSMLMTASYSGQVLLYLIGNILDSSKIEAGRFDVDRIPMNIVEEVQKISQIEQEIAKPKGINLHTIFLNQLPRMVFGDPMRFTQILINIIGNAIKFTTRGYVAIVIRWAKDTQEARENYFEKMFKGPRNKFGVYIPPVDFFLSEPFLSYATQKNSHKKSFQEIRSQRLIDDDSPLVAIEMECLIDSVNKKLQKYSIKPKKKHKDTSISEQPTVHPVFFRHSEQNLRIPPLKLSGLTSVDEPILATPNQDTRVNFGDSGILVVEIIDTGPGMTEEEQKRLFQPFSQANSAVKRKFGGTGLGLWISKQLVNLMCGLIEVRSQQSVGTIFKLTIPFKIVESDESMPKEQEEENKNLKQHAILDKFFTPTNTMFQAITDLRDSRKYICKGPNSAITELKILILESDNEKEDNKLEQVLTQLFSNTCELYYSSYSSITTSLKEANFDFRFILVLACSSIAKVKNTITQLQQTIKEKNAAPIPAAIISGIFIDQYSFIIRCYNRKRICGYGGYKNFNISTKTRCSK